MFMLKLFSNRLLLIGSLATIVLLIVAGIITWHIINLPPAPPQATCGEVALFAGGSPQPYNKDAQQSEDCFYHAFQNCAAVTLDVHYMGVDTGSDTIYWPDRQGNTCRLIEQFSSYGLVSSANRTETGTCQGLARKNGGLLFLQCDGSGDIFIPPGKAM
jgi:hypothetical protein